MNAAAWAVIGAAVGNIGTWFTTWLLGKNERKRLAEERTTAKELADKQHTHELTKFGLEDEQADRTRKREQIARWRSELAELKFYYVSEGLSRSSLTGVVWFEELRPYLDQSLPQVVSLTAMGSPPGDDDFRALFEEVARIEKEWKLI